MRKNGRLERSDLVPGARIAVVYTDVEVAKDRPLELDPHLGLSGRNREITGPTGMTVVRGPHRSQGVNLVTVSVDGLPGTHEMFYCDIVSCCRMVTGQ